MQGTAGATTAATMLILIIASNALAWDMPRTASVRIEYTRRLRPEFGTDHDPRSTTSVCAFDQLQEDWDVRDTGGEVRQSSCVRVSTTKL
jgi:hypothetical protein